MHLPFVCDEKLPAEYILASRLEWHKFLFNHKIPGKEYMFFDVKHKYAPEVHLFLNHYAKDVEAVVIYTFKGINH